MSWTFMQSFSFIPLMAAEKKIFEYFFRKFSPSVAMATNQNVMNLYAKFQLHPPYGCWEEDFWIFFSKI